MDEKDIPIRYSCFFTRSRAGEQFVPEHAVGYVVSGSLQLTDGNSSRTFGPGEVYFCRRNHFAKYMKCPPEGGEFRSVSIFFEQEMLRQFSFEYGYKAEKTMPEFGFDPIEPESVLAHYMNSLRAYETIFEQQKNKELLVVKQKEAVLLLLRARPDLKHILFDFTEPGKIDLEAFMNKNYHFNVGLKRFAYLSGRSLSTFKRDFESIFHITPSKWLLRRRLQEAYYLIKEKGKAVSDVYLDVGFEDLSHFSFTFKKQYGIAPSNIS
jgi:AraC-like DNA-binding protein